MKLKIFIRFVFATLIGLAWLPGIFAKEDVHVNVVSDIGSHIILDYKIRDYQSQAVTIQDEEFTRIWIPGEPVLQEKGAPALPHINRSIIIPDDAQMVVQVLSTSYEEKLAKIVPSKGYLPRTINPDHVPYEFGEAYEIDAFYPGPVATLSEPYILRDHRGIVVQIKPFQYNPKTGVLRVYKEIMLKVVAKGPGEKNVFRRGDRVRARVRAFEDIYSSQFLNYKSYEEKTYTESAYYDPIDEEGDMLIIAHDQWIDDLDAFVSHKFSMNIPATVVGVSTIGNDATSIKDYIQDVYDTSDLAFVLLVGDADEVATPITSGGASDPCYAKLAGDDHYPEIIVGRFSAQTAAELETQIQRTIDYEMMPANEMDWFWRGVGIASNQGAGQGDEGQADNVHIGEIRTWLLGAGYTHVDEIYDPSGTDTMVTEAVNDGRGIINYCGHGSPSSWGSTGFNIYDVDALTNDSMLPFIISVACNNGEFNNYNKCFAEAWLRATNNSNGEPTGAIGMYASSISQSWAPPMEAQDEFNLLLTDPTKPYFSYGAMCFAGSCSMMDNYGSAGVSMFNTWIIFGDPSLRIIGTASKLTYESHFIDDSNPNYGNGDGNIDYGETIRMVVTLRNLRIDPAANVWAILSTSNTGVEIRDRVAYYPDIPGEGTAESLFPHFTFTVNEDCGSLIGFKMEIYHDDSLISYSNFPISSGVEVETVFYEDDMETDQGWIVSGTEVDNNWVLDDPYEVLDGSDEQIQPEDDTTIDPGINCWITGNPRPKGNFVPEDGDVDELAILESPVFDASGATSLTLEMYRWFYILKRSDQDASYLDIAISDDGGSSYHTLESITSQSNAWTLRSFDATSVVQPSSQMKIRVRVERVGSAAGEVLLEGGIDDVKVNEIKHICESFIMPPANPPNPIGNTLMISMEGSNLKLEWQEPPVDATHDAATLYRIYCSSQPDTGFEEIGSATGTFYYHIDELNGPNSWYYKVVAENGGGSETE